MVIRHLFLAAALLALLAASCALMSGGDAQSPARVPGRAAHFPHAVHLGEEAGLLCIDCHEGAEDEDRAGMPDFEFCATCHFGDEGEAQLAPFHDAEGGPRFTTATAPSTELRFSHARHAAAEVACADCHGELRASDAVPRDVHVPMSRCLSCHAARGGGPLDDCSACHEGVDRHWAPPSHQASWERAHGRLVRGGGGGDPNRDCALCHEGPDGAPECLACHLEQQPRDHTPFFRNSGHGMLALFDRRRCLACHQEDACASCHTSTRPRSHVAGFGAPSDRHCLSCHLETGQLRACMVCHFDGAPAHELAPTPPSTVPAHADTGSCLRCHATVRPPNHPYTGDGNYCRSCHR